MRYISTRGAAPSVDFRQALLNGMAPDGGLYLPEIWPQLHAADIEALKGQPYSYVAAAILHHYSKDFISFEELKRISREAYKEFSAPDVAPLRKISEADFILELHHGPTLAFKDYAMQLLARLFKKALHDEEERRTLLVATSGDTGAAAVSAFKNNAKVDIVVLYPHEKISSVQRLMMTTLDAENICLVAVKGNFDDCQRIVKSLFADTSFSNALSLGALNSINWARLAAQIPYYIYAWLKASPSGEAVRFVAPTGNFGNVFAGYAARKMGVPIDRFVVATNKNDILRRVIETGVYAPSETVPTFAPSMDIQTASNFERLLYDITDENTKGVIAKTSQLARTGRLELSGVEHNKIKALFSAGSATDEDIVSEMKLHYEATGAFIDPHTAVARHVLRTHKGEHSEAATYITLATAHAGKFPEVVKRATHIYPELPAPQQSIFNKEESMTHSENDIEAVKSVIINHASRRT